MTSILFFDPSVIRSQFCGDCLWLTDKQRSQVTTASTDGVNMPGVLGSQTRTRTQAAVVTLGLWGVTGRQGCFWFCSSSSVCVRHMGWKLNHHTPSNRIQVYIAQVTVKVTCHLWSYLFEYLERNFVDGPFAFPSVLVWDSLLPSLSSYFCLDR